MCGEKALSATRVQKVHVAFNNFFASPSLMEDLRAKEIYSTATIRPNRKDRLVNIEVSSIGDNLSPIANTFETSIELSPILLKIVIDKVSAVLLGHKYRDTNTFQQTTTLGRQKHCISRLGWL